MSNNNNSIPYPDLPSDDEKAAASARQEQEQEQEPASQVGRAMSEIRDSIAVTLSLVNWKLIDFLARRGAIGEIERALLDPKAHRSDCTSGFVAAIQAIHEQVPELGELGKKVSDPAPAPDAN